MEEEEDFTIGENWTSCCSLLEGKGSSVAMKMMHGSMEDSLDDDNEDVIDVDGKDNAERHN